MALDIGLGSIVGSAISGAFGMAGEKLRYENEKELASQQNQYNLDMWRMQNEYNSPAAQMQRFKEAGLNPNLIYGQGSNGNSQTAPHMVTPGAADYTEHMSKLGQLFNVAGLMSAVEDYHIKREKAQQEAIKTQDDLNKLNAKAVLSGVYRWDYDPQSGTWKMLPEYPNQEYITGRYPLRDRWKKTIMSIGSSAKGWDISKLKEDMYRINKPIHIRAALAAPEITMRSFQAVPWRMKTSWWLKQIGSTLGSAKDAVSLFY